jgi:hypothetical protein
MSWVLQEITSILEDFDWNHLAHNKEQWRILVNTEIKARTRWATIIFQRTAALNEAT